MNHIKIQTGQVIHYRLDKVYRLETFFMLVDNDSTVHKISFIAVTKQGMIGFESLREAKHYFKRLRDAEKENQSRLVVTNIPVYS